MSALAPDLLAYLAGGSESETALARNRAALAALALVPRVLQDVSRIEGSVEFLGRRLAWPLLLAPVGSLHLLHGQGIDGVRQAAEQAGIAYAVGSALPGSHTVTASSQVPTLYQLYAEGDAAWLADACRAAAARGFHAVALTVDAPVFPRRPRDEATGNHAAGRERNGTSQHRQTLSWRTVEQMLAAGPGLPLILKGLQDPRDADIACGLGVAGVYLSNHGGRQYDQGPGTARLIAPMAQAIAGRVPLIVDGGFASGNDVLKAVALGADIVALGRAYLHPFAEGGSAALSDYLGTLVRELRTNRALLGTPAWADVRGLRVLDDAPQGGAARPL